MPGEPTGVSRAKKAKALRKAPNAGKKPILDRLEPHQTGGVADPITPRQRLNMKPGTSKPFPSRPDEIVAAIKAAPEQVHDPECPYDPNDPAAVEAFWKGATVRRPGRRGPGKKAKKVLLSVRYSPEVVDYFKSTGEGWQTRMDEALKEWVAARREE